MASNDISRVYAQSLVEVGDEKKMLPLFEEEMLFLSNLLKEDRDVWQFFASPGLTKESKRDFVNKVFGNKLSEPVINLLYVLIENGRQSFIPEIYQSMLDSIDVINNRMRVTVTTTQPLDDTLREKLKSVLSKRFNKEIILNETVDESIIGGIIIRIGDTVIDGSLLKDLKNIRKNLLISKVRSDAAYED
jgi:F-type H+-transporting ATPase subunit delta